MDKIKLYIKNFELCGNSLVIVLISAVILFVYVPISLYLGSIHYKLNVVIDGQKTVLTYPVTAGDSTAYAITGYNILNHHIFSAGTAMPLAPSTFTMPLYPFLLAVWKFLFGSFTLFPILQMVFAGFSAFLIFLLGKKFFSEKVGFLASFLFMIDPTVIFHTLTLMTDITYVFLLVLSVWLLFGSDYENRYVVCLFAGLIFGLSLLTRSVSTFLIFLIVPIYYIVKRKEIDSKKILAQLLIIVLAYAAVAVPWMIRNKEVSGVFGIGADKDVNLFHYYVPNFLSYKKGISVDAARDILVQDLAKKIGPAQAENWGTLSNSPAVESVALKYIESDPIGYGKFHLIKTIPFFLSSGIKNFILSYNDMMGFETFNTNGGNMTDLILHARLGQFIEEIKVQPWVTLEEVYWVLVVIFMLVAVLFSKNRVYVLSFAIIVVYFAVATGSVAYSRYRLPALPFMLLLACQGFMILKNKLQLKSILE